MDKKKFMGCMVLIFIVVVFICVNVTKDEAVEVGSDYDTSYYVEASDNFFVRVAKLCDTCCYYMVDMVLGGIETVFSSITGSNT